jgi:hypothetical protein
MPVVSWLAQLVRSTIWLAVNLVIVTGLFLLSAHLSSQSGTDERNGGLFFRAVASFWFYIAAWTWFVRGVLNRPYKRSEKRKPTGAEATRGALGCLANLVPIPFVFIYGGRLADWAWAGIVSDDTSHPARRLSDQLLTRTLYAVEHAGEWVPWAVGGLVAYNVVKAVLTARARRNRTQPEPKHAVGRPDVSDANKATLDKLRKKRPQKPPRAARSAGGREILAEAGLASAQTVGAAHAGAHGPDMSRFTPAAGAREDRVLGALSFSSSDGAWWARRPDEGFPVQLEGAAEGPDPHALDLARQVVQRNFEALLRASEAARPVAQGRGVGLPRFTIAAARVGTGTSPAVTLHLRCDADPGHEYLVVSTDNLNTFTAA